MPSLDGASEWLNSKTQNGQEFKTKKAIERVTKGRLTLVHFWSTSNELSKTNLSQIADLRDQRKREGLRVIAIHVPETENQKKLQTVRDAVERLNLTEPCALDNDYRLRSAFLKGNDSIPSYFLFDTEPKLRASADGANGLEVIEDEMDQLLMNLRKKRPFCPECELFLNEEAMFCSECGLPLSLPGGMHPYYEHHHSASLPTVRLVNPDPLLGHRIDGKYELLARTGEGGMSVVYRARRVHIGDEVAVKVMLPKLAKDEQALARFRREATAAAMLHHPNIITIHDFGDKTEGGTPPFIVMEYVKGTPLREMLRSEDPLPIERTQRWMRGVLAGVGAAHRKGVVHRDLKPDNVLVVAPDVDYEFESVKVVDFGFAKMLTDDGVGPTETIVGTPYYMSPEQCLGESLDTRSDVYSLGAMFYEMVSGNPPFKAETVSGIIAKQLSEPPPPLFSSLRIPRRIQTAIMHALAKDPNDRPQTATDLARQMQFI